MKDLVWLDGIVRDADNRWKTKGLFRARHGVQMIAFPVSKMPASVVDTRARYSYRTDTRAMPFSWPDISLFEELIYPSELLKSIREEYPFSDRHAIYKNTEDNIYIPAALFIKALFMGNKLLDRILLIPGVLDTVGQVRTTDSEIYLVPSCFVRSVEMSNRNMRTIAWLHLNQDARNAHASILRSAKQGNIGLDLPRVSIDGWLLGIQTKTGLLATELFQLDIRFPIKQKRIIYTAGKRTLECPSYQPPVKSPLSMERRNCDR